MPYPVSARRPFHVEIIKPSRYDDDGYVVQWLRAIIPSNSLACLFSLARAAGKRQVLGADVELVVNVHDEANTIIPVEPTIRRTRGRRGIVLLAGVQSNQFSRAADLARAFRAADVPVAIGGFHVSGCLAMLPELPPELKELQDLGVALFAGEAEGHLESLLLDAHRGNLQPLYNVLKDLPDLRGQEMPFLPMEAVHRSMSTVTFDAGRGCPFQCSFCTIINVQGRKSRFRDADDVERFVRANLARDIQRFFITDDDLARNKNWEPIFDRLIKLREQEGWIHLKLMIQVDTQCHKVPGFIDKAVRAGCTRVFIGMESVNPENLAASGKHHNHVHEYRVMLQAWRTRGVLTQAGYILGFPADTPESIERDIATIQRELPVDILEFFMLTPLPGSADHRELHRRGVWMDPDLNLYDSEHAVTAHPRMTAEEWQAIYDRAWHLYYSPRHVETLLRRARAGGARTRSVAGAIFTFYGSRAFEGIHPLQAGVFRRKIRQMRRPGLPIEKPLRFYARRIFECVRTYARAGWYYWWLTRLRRRIERDPRACEYTESAISLLMPASVDRNVADIPGFDRDLAKDPAWQRRFKENRARQNAEALDTLDLKAIRVPSDESGA
jgi:radical SAM superfamily enzyme YgiQ (UPF0313 family)